jgi:hypothetical protein
MSGTLEEFNSLASQSSIEALWFWMSMHNKDFHW